MRREQGQSSCDMDPYVSLGNAIIIQAARDYKVALRKLSRNKYNKDALNEKEEIERFFHSGWFGVLTEIDPDMFIRKLQEVAYE